MDLKSTATFLDRYAVEVSVAQRLASLVLADFILVTR